MILILQYVTMVILQNDFFGVCSFIPFAAVIGGFEYGYQKRKSQADDTAKKFRRRFYQISAWLGLYFPIRFVVHLLAHGGFEYGYQKRKSQADDTAKKFRRRFYQISAWLGLYFPIRFVVHLLAHLYPRPYSTLVRSLVVLAVYGVTAALVCRIIWLGLYFPIRFVVHLLAHLYPRPYSTLVRSLVVLAVYGVTAALVCRIIRRKGQKES